MQTLEYTTLDRTDWPSGPWDSEPDKRQWQDPTTGLPCLAVRNSLGVWCGYVGVSEGHPFFAVGYMDLESALDVHGGLTYSAFCQPEAESHGICHKPDAGEADHVWWFGFDCCHSDDSGPRRQDGTYRTLAYVERECGSLAKQLAEKSDGVEPSDGAPS